MARVISAPALSASVDVKASRAALVFALGEVFLAAYIVIGFGAYQVNGTMPNLALGLLGAGILFLAPKQAVWKMPFNGLLFLWAGWMATTYFWSVDIFKTSHYLRFELLQVLGALGCAAVLPLRRFKRGLLCGMYAAVTITYFGIATSAAARTQYDPVTGAVALHGWHGFFLHKNDMAPFLVVALAAVWCFEESRRVKRIFTVAVLVLLANAASATGLSALMVLIVGWYWLKRLAKETSYKRLSFMLFSILGLGGLVAVGIGVLPAIVNLYGKDTTFSGRVYIWRAVTWAIGRQPIFGYGRAAVFNNGSIGPTQAIAARVGFEPAHAHNAFLEAWLETGIVGAVLFVMAFFDAFGRAWRRLNDRTEVASWGVLTLLVILAIAFSEVPVFGIWMSLIGMVGMLCSRHLDDDDPFVYGAWVAPAVARRRALGNESGSQRG